MRSDDSLEGRLRLGSTLTFITGLFVLGVATYFFIQLWRGVANPSEPWRSGGFGPSPYTLDGIRSCNPTLASDFIAAQHIEFANVINTAFVILVVTVFGLRRRQRWAWYTLLATFLWVGLNDAVALLMAKQPLVPLIPEVIGLVGLFIARPALFDGSSVPRP
jgi:hypothetical protein